MLRRVFVGCVVTLVCSSCEDPEPTAELPANLGETREMDFDLGGGAGPQRWGVRPHTAEEGGPLPPRTASGGGGGGGGRSGGARRDRTPNPTTDQILARLGGLRGIGDDDSACEQAFRALQGSNEGMADLFEQARPDETPSKTEYVEGCESLPEEMQECMAPEYLTAHQESCAAVFREHGEPPVNNPIGWIARFTKQKRSDLSPETRRAIRRNLRRQRERDRREAAMGPQEVTQPRESTPFD